MPGVFYIATYRGAVEQHGYVLAGLGLHHHEWVAVRTKTHWTMTHIGSGGAIAHLVGDVAMVMPVATEIAHCTDWTLFDRPSGWRQTQPDLPQLLQAIYRAHPEARPIKARGALIDDKSARAVMQAREATP